MNEKESRFFGIKSKCTTFVPEINQKESKSKDNMTNCKFKTQERLSMDKQASNEGLYQSGYEHDACGVGMVVNIHGGKSHEWWTMR